MDESNVNFRKRMDVLLKNFICTSKYFFVPGCAQ